MLVETVESGVTSQAWIPITDEDRERVRTNLEQLLEHPLFSHSKRLPAFLRFVVLESLQSTENGALKERTIGIIAFGRQADYDTNLDPVVRITAGEVRKKLAQYYYDNGKASELRIELPPGSYLPRFRFISQISAAQPLMQQEKTDTACATVVVNAPVELQPKPPQLQTISQSNWRWLAAAMLAVLLLGTASAVWNFAFSKSDVDRFWLSFADASPQVLIVLPTIQRISQDPVTTGYYRFEGESVALEDAAVASKITGQLQIRRLQSRLMLSNDTSLADLRSGPSVLVGAFDNTWTIRSVTSLPYVFERSEDHRYGRIIDTKGQHSWIADFAVPNVKTSTDYGIVARFTNPLTDQRVLILAGLAAEGTFAAGESITNPQYLKLLMDAGATSKNNFEAVIQTQMVDGKSGPPHIVAFQKW